MFGLFGLTFGIMLDSYNYAMRTCKWGAGSSHYIIFYLIKNYKVYFSRVRPYSLYSFNYISVIILCNWQLHFLCTTTTPILKLKQMQIQSLLHLLYLSFFLLLLLLLSFSFLNLIRHLRHVFLFYLCILFFLLTLSM